MKKLFSYQQEAAQAVLDTEVGQVILPTGTGKTNIQAAVLSSRMKQNNRQFSINVILTPRILLTNQIMKEVAKQLKLNDSVEMQVITVHSGKPTDFYDDETEEEIRRDLAVLKNESTTNSQTLQEKIELAKIDNVPLLICSTYDSSNVVARALKQTGEIIDQVLCDEAHYIVEKKFYKNVKSLKRYALNVHYFTATQKITDSDEGNGMNNVEMYGEVVYRKDPNWMVVNGYMVPPRIHHEFVSAATPWPVVVKDGFEKHQSLIQTEPKLLVCCDGTKTLSEIANDPSFKQYCKINGITIFHISSKLGPFINDEKVERNYFLDQLKQIKGKAVILHIGILTEGISVPDISGVMFIRNMGLCRFLQSLGRATRVLRSDRGKPYAEWVKKFAYAIIVDRDNVDQRENLEKMVCQLREAGFEPQERIKVACDRKLGEEIDMDIVNQKDPKVFNNFKELFEILHEIECEILAKASFEEQLRMLSEEFAL